jgi:hypothetical protein
MPSLIEQIDAAWERRERREVDVPEWGVKFCVWPITLKQLSLIQGEADPFLRALRIIQVRGKTESGLQMIDQATYDKLAQRGVGPFGPDVVVRVAGQIMADTPSAEDVAKN